jgi:hypothetical protein
VSRELRALVPAELAAVAAIACVPMPVPRVLPLLVVASASRWARGRGWGEVARPAFAGIAAAAGVVALAVALALGGPAVETVTGRAVEWSQFPIVRGSPSSLLTVGMLVAATIIAAELVLRGWLVERALELRVPRAAAVLAGSLTEAAVSDGDLVARLGAAVLGVALGWMYVACGRSVVAPICARGAFALGALLLEALRLVS